MSTLGKEALTAVLQELGFRVVVQKTGTFISLGSQEKRIPTLIGISSITTPPCKRSVMAITS